MTPSVLNVATPQADPVQSAKEASKASHSEIKYPSYLPFSDLTERFPPNELFEYTDPGLRANPAKPNLLGLPGTSTIDISPYLGTEIKGVQLSQLSQEGLDELALLTAERKVVIFRDQDFKDLGAERQMEIARHFGPLHRHPLSPHIKGHPEFHIVYRGAENNVHNHGRPGAQNRTNWPLWHSDVTYERQPPGATFFWILEQPEAGGDTLFLSQVEAYNRLSPAFKKLLVGLRAVHSGVQQAEMATRSGNVIRQEPIETEHPIVRVHPVTGEKALFVDQHLTRSIVGLHQEESETLLKFLLDHVSKGADFQIRARYEPGSVIVWDNRVTLHSTTRDFSTNARRHAARLTPQAEVPIPAKAED